MSVIANDISSLRHSEPRPTGMFVSLGDGFNPFVDLYICFVSFGHFPANGDVFALWPSGPLPYP
jgi:hypothetical protein